MDAESQSRPQTIDAFIAQAREKQLSDNDILALATQAGWQRATVLAELERLATLAAPNDNNTGPRQNNSPEKNSRPSLSSLIAAMHHIFLWFFVGTSAFTCYVLVANLFTYTDDGYDIVYRPATPIKCIIAALVTLSAYMAFYIPYLHHTLKPPYVTAGKTWSIVTIALSSIGAIITATVTVLLVTNDAKVQWILVAALICVFCIAVALTYWAATFVSPKKKLRSGILIGGVAVMVCLTVTVSALFLLHLPGARHDETLRNNLTKTAENILAYADKHNALPKATTPFIITGSDITYKPTSTSAYQLCGRFQQRKDFSYGGQLQDSDIDLHPSSFPSKHVGENCFTFFTSAHIEGRPTSEQEYLDHYKPEFIFMQ